MHVGLCICLMIPRLVTRTRLLLVIHNFEDNKPTNTGRLAAECLVNSRVIVRGKASLSGESLGFSSDTIPVLLYPSEDATPLVELAASLTNESRPITLIVPDGSWRQASKVRKRLPGVGAARCVSLPLGGASRYRLRSAPDLHRLSTIEAIARALGILEGPEIRTAMELPFHAMVERTLWMRGKLDSSSVTGGVPQGAVRHDPRSGLRAVTALQE